MIPTQVRWLNRLNVAQPDATEWRRLNEIYLPLIRIRLARVPAHDHEAADLDISENAILLAKSRVLKGLRAEAAGLLDEFRCFSDRSAMERAFF